MKMRTTRPKRNAGMREEEEVEEEVGEIGLDDSTRLCLVVGGSCRG